VRALQYIALAHLQLGDPAEAALEMAKSATEWARKMPMLVGVIYGLTFQGLALARLGRHAEAIALSDEALALTTSARPDGVEHIYRWRADILWAAGKHDLAKVARASAAAEIDAKAQRLRDPELRELYLTSRRQDVS
jgi:tetratricopeptide (TPR) repeat protein